MKQISIINGPNLNMLGVREPEIYGSSSLQAIESAITKRADKLKVSTVFFQSNSEAEIISAIQSCYQKTDGIILNAGAYTHYSYAIYDALRAVNIPTIEVHLSNINAREDFRKISVISPACIGQICGLGVSGYICALDYFVHSK